MDRKSSQHIYSALLSPSGLLVQLGCAVALVTHSSKPPDGKSARNETWCANLHAAQFLPRFETILILDKGAIAHAASYQELLAEGILNEETLSGSAKSSSRKGVETSVDSVTGAKDAVAESAAAMESRAPSDFSVYAYYLGSCGAAGMVVFFVLAAILAGERSFESRPTSQPGTPTYPTPPIICAVTNAVILQTSG